MKKNFKLILALVLSIMMVLGTVSALADPTPHTITIKNTNPNISINGKVYSAYKLFDATRSGTASAYTLSTSSQFYDATLVSGTPATNSVFAVLKQYFTFTAIPGDNTKVSVTAIGTLDARAFADAIQPKLSGLTADKTSAAATNETATINLDNDADGLGYYIVTGAAAPTDDDSNPAQEIVSAVIISNEDPTADIEPKADAPSIKKELDTPLDSTKKDENEKAIGDTVSYTITSEVPDMTAYNTQYYYIVTDKLSGGLTFQPSTLDVKLNNAAPTEGYDVFYSLNGSEATPTWVSTFPTDGYDEGDELYIKIVFKDFIEYKNLKDAPIVITYDAILNDSAVIGNAGNPNDVKLTYSNNPYNEGDGTHDEPQPGDAVGNTPWHTTKTYVSGIKLEKIDPETNEKLSGVEFTITGTNLNDIKETSYERYVYVGGGNGTHYLLKDGTYTTTAIQNDPNENGYNGDKYAETVPNYKLETGAAFSKTGTQIVTYKATTDSNGLITLEGLKEGTYTITEIKTKDGYNLLTAPVSIEVKAQTKTENGKTVFDKWVFKKDNAAQYSDANDSNLYKFQVENRKGATLPSTGGVGTTIFYIAGSILVLAAAILLITKRRMGTND